MLIGAHGIIYSARAEEDRAFLRDVLGLPSVDAGGGWLIFGLPPGELSIHPVEGSDPADRHELYLMCASVEEFVAEMRRSGVRCGAVQDLEWGRLVQILMPGGGKLGVYEPLHARPESLRPSARARAGAGRAARKGAKATKATKATKRGAAKTSTRKKGAGKKATATKQKGAAKKGATRSKAGARKTRTRGR